MTGQQFDNKVLLVLTDGDDTRFVKGGKFKSPGDPKYNKNSKGDPKEIPAFLKDKFKDSDIRVNMVFFNAPTDELDSIKEQFECIEDKAWRTPGKIYYAQDADRLKERLHEGLLGDFYYDVQDPQDKPVKPFNAERSKITRVEDRGIDWFGVKNPVEGQYTLQLRGRSTSARPARMTFLLKLRWWTDSAALCSNALSGARSWESITRRAQENRWKIGNSAYSECKERILDQSLRC